MLLLLVLVLAGLCTSSTSGNPVVLHHPKSRLAPLGVEVTFTCKIENPNNAHWVIDEETRLFTDSAAVEMARSKGYLISKKQDNMTNIASLMLTFNVTMDKNGTEIYCSSLATNSNVAVLLTIIASPLPRNPSIINPNASSILVKWSPPYLWPGYSIDHYIISIGGTGKSTVLNDVNAMCHDAVATFLEISDTPEIWNCNELQFGISAITNETDRIVLQPFTIVGGYLPDVTNISSSDVNITVLFGPNGSPLAIVIIELPRTICSYQHLNYSILINSDGEVFHHGPYHQYGSDPIREIINSGLEEGREYTLMVTIETQVGTVHSQQYSFNTILQAPDNQPENKFELETTIFMSTTVVLSLSLLLTAITIICCFLYRQVIRNSKSTVEVEVNSSTSRAYHANVMQTNPIYEGPGPVYDYISQVQPQSKTAPPVEAQEPSNMATGSIIHTRSDPLGSSGHRHIFPETDNSDSLTHDFRVSNSYESKVPTPLSLTSSSPHTNIALNITQPLQGKDVQPATVTTLKGSGDLSDNYKHSRTIAQAIRKKDLSHNNLKADQGEEGDERDEYVTMKSMVTLSGSMAH